MEKKGSFSSKVKRVILNDALDGELTNREIIFKYGIKTKSTIQ